MSLSRKVKRIGGSLGIIVPKDVAENMGLEAGSSVRLSIVGRQMVVEPQDDVMPEGAFRRAFAAVLRKYEPALQALADHDAGRETSFGRRSPARGRRRKLRA